uniref:Uncharacterized protein n=1 Tax=Oryza glumipatula TaxID=40148 RepID=A0A0E0A1B2_9ORYZ
MNARTQNLTPMSIFEDWAGKSWRLTKSPQAARCRQSGMHREHEPKSVTVQKRVFRTVDLPARSSTATRCRRVLCVLR